MEQSFPAGRPSSTKIDGSFAYGPEENFQPDLVGYVCRKIWGPNTDAKIAVICAVSDRSAREYLSGRVAIPAVLLAAINVALSRRP